VCGWHEQLVARHGGGGLRDAAALRDALAAPRTLHARRPQATAEELASVYAVSLLKAAAFTDGNARIAFAVMAAYLRAQDRRLDVTEDAAVAMMRELAAGDTGAYGLAIWLRDHSQLV
jgi:death-on-curing protein